MTCACNTRHGQTVSRCAARVSTNSETLHHLPSAWNWSDILYIHLHMITCTHQSDVKAVQFDLLLPISTLGRYGHIQRGGSFVTSGKDNLGYWSCSEAGRWKGRGAWGLGWCGWRVKVGAQGWLVEDGCRSVVCEVGAKVELQGLIAGEREGGQGTELVFRTNANTRSCALTPPKRNNPRSVWWFEKATHLLSIRENVGAGMHRVERSCSSLQLIIGRVKIDY